MSRAALALARAYIAAIVPTLPHHREEHARVMVALDAALAAPDLLDALRRVMANDCPLTGNPTHAQLVEHWEYEKTQGRGEADDQLFALAALAEATPHADT